MAWLVDTLAMGWLHAGWQKNYSHSQEKHWKGLCPSAVHRGGYYPLSVKPGCRWTHRGTQWEWMLHTGVCAILINGKFPNTVSQLLQEGEYRTTVVW